MADIVNAHQAGQDTATPTGDATLRAGAQADNALASKTLFDSLFPVHQDSFNRNSGDSKKDAEAMQGDNDSVKLADHTAKLTDSLKDYLAAGGNFTDVKGANLAYNLVGALRQERADHADDRKTDLEYAGPNGVPKQLQADLLFDSKQIGENASQLTKPGLTADARENILKSIVAGSAAIAANIAENGGKTGKDLNDASAESKVISADANALLSGKLTSEQSKLVIADMDAKAALIKREVGDIADETNYAHHDSAAIKAGGDLEAVTASAMQSHSAKTLQQLASKLEGYHNTSGTGILDTVVQDRQADLRLEPEYIRANNADNGQHNAPILLQFSRQ